MANSVADDPKLAPLWDAGQNPQSASKVEVHRFARQYGGARRDTRSNARRDPCKTMRAARHAARASTRTRTSASCGRGSRRYGTPTNDRKVSGFGNRNMTQ